MASRIEDYAVIGDRESAALVGRDGSIDWLSLPRFDSDAFLAALLGGPENGYWRIAPTGGARTTRRGYRDGTMILETELENDDGAITLVDFMCVDDVDPSLVRVVVGRRGKVRVRSELVLRFNYGRTIPWVQRHDGGILAVAGPDQLRLVSPVAMHGKDFRTVGETVVAAGDRVPFTLAWAPSHRPPPAKLDPEASLAGCETWWREWVAHCRCGGVYDPIVQRSLLVLKALTYGPTGGIVAAPTTSLPESVGSSRNWDYRFAWLRDSTFTLMALLAAGFTEEARAWRDWLVRAAAGAPAQLQIMYGLAGERRLDELELDWLRGYEDSRPVRVGNAASSQLQLDVYGELVDALFHADRAGLPLHTRAWAIQRSIVRHLEDVWHRPDHGIWEVRGPPRHFVHSKVMCWVAFDRAVKAVELWGRDGPADAWRRARDAVHEEICEKGFDPERNAFVQFYGSKDPDASLLLLPLVGFLPPDDPRIVGTVELVQRELMPNGLVARYPTRPEVDGLPPGEGVFLACSFWLADALVTMGRHDEARELFERLVRLTNDVGLLAEEYDPAARRMLGNFPQALSHVALVNTALNLSRPHGPANVRRRPAS